MEVTPFLPLPEGMLIDQVQITENGLLITVIATHPTSRCPLCSEFSSSIHSSYRRRLRDVSCGGRHVQLSLQSIGLSTCGKGGAKLAARLGMQASRHTILRRIMDLPDSSAGSVVYVGVDDFSFRRGYRFGTLLVNLESHRVVDLLPDRRAETAAQWLRKQPDVMVVSRDRGGEYASAVTQGAPQAIQCADRLHIVKNLTEAAQLLVARGPGRNPGASEA